MVLREERQDASVRGALVPGRAVQIEHTLRKVWLQWQTKAWTLGGTELL